MKIGIINYKLVDSDKLNTKKRSKDKAQHSKPTIQLSQTNAKPKTLEQKDQPTQTHGINNETPKRTPTPR